MKKKFKKKSNNLLKKSKKKSNLGCFFKIIIVNKGKKKLKLNKENQKF